MFLPGYKDLVKSQWVATLEELKLAGELPVSELSRRLGMSYMAVKQYCETLKNLGYLARTRAPRAEVGRPEIFYQLAPKAALLFPQAGVDFSLELLENLRGLFGENAPERLIFQYFQQRQQRWQARLAKGKSLMEKATLLAGLLEQDGCFCRCKYDPENGVRIEAYHQPLQPVFAKFPRALGMELRLFEALLGTRVTRREIHASRHGPARVDFEVATLGVL
ncbi:MAG: helix-turn-helix domain-containing protein [Verrucomicrobia bacterium]|nr:MAG: helix-turn-helix domain-containing protein [Verrucomicrobiota bacterium]